MAKNDFDIDFDFEEEYGFDPKAFLDEEEYDSNIDLSEFSDEDLGLTPPAPADEEPEEEESFLDEELPPEQEEELPYSPLEGFPREEAPEESFDEGEEEYPQEPEYDQEPEFQDEAEDEEPEEPRKKPKKEKKVKPPREPKPKKEFHTPKFITKFYDLYFAPLTNKELRDEPQDPNNPRRRRRKTRAQVFKEVYLPPILVGVCLVLVLSFVMGSVSNLIAQYAADRSHKEGQQQQQADDAALAEQRYQRIMNEAKALANSYDYKGAIEKLQSFGDMSEYPEMSALHAEYQTVQSQMVEYNDPAMIPNLSFHVLIQDPVRAFKDQELGGKYNRNFVTTQEFTNILSQLYHNGYVLVDFDSFVSASAGVDGSEMFFSQPIYLPADKKPIMLTETMVNYFNYMIDSNDDGVADAGGDGFASKLVVQNGEIKAEYVDADGNTLVGDYDFVPILESFIKANPDFVYRGARATLAVTGKEGVFGYRVNTTYIASKGNAWQEEQVAGAKEVVQALRDKGYRIACFTYGNVAYKTMTVQQIQQDLTDWTTHITPVLGKVDTMVFAQTSDITDYTGNAYNVLYTSGFRYFVANGEQPWAEITTSHVRQKRLMVTGNAMQWHTKQFNGIFDCGSILDVNSRGNVPND